MHGYIALAALIATPMALSAQAPAPTPADQPQPVVPSAATKPPQKTGRPVAAPPTPANHSGTPAGDQPHAAPGNANARNPDPRG